MGNLTMRPPPPPRMLLGVISQFAPLLQFGQEENITGLSVERRAYWFVLKIARVFSIPTGRVGIG